MKKKRFDLNPGAEFSPGTNIGAVPDALHTAIRDLLPELLPYKELIDKMNQYFFLQQGSHDCELFKEICLEVEQVTGPGKWKNLELFITVLDGMRDLVEENHLATPDDMNGYLENNKQNFKENHWELFSGINGLKNDSDENLDKPGMDTWGHPLQKRK